MTAPKDIMTDIRRAMHSATPRPNADRKAEAMERSLEVFAKQHRDAAPKDKTPDRPFKIWGGLKAAFARTIRRTTGPLAAASAVVAATILVLSPQGQELLQGLSTAPPQRSTAAPPPPPPSSSTVEEIIAEITSTNTGVADAVPPAPQPRAIADSTPTAVPSTSSVQTRQILPSGDLDPTGGAPQPQMEGFVAGAPTSPQAYLFSEDTALAPARPISGSAPLGTAVAPPLRIPANDLAAPIPLHGATGVYSTLREALAIGQLPAPDDLRIEEMVNAFTYDYPAPAPDSASALQPTVQVFQTPWNSQTRLMHVALQAQRPLAHDRAPVNLVLLVDTSGSMDAPLKLPLLLQALRQTLSHLTPRDEIAIVTYAGRTGVALPPTSGQQTDTLLQAVSDLQAGTTVQGTGSLEEAYRLAAQMTHRDEVSRILLVTDGEFDMGLADPASLSDMLAQRQNAGTTLSVLQLAQGGQDDALIQAVAHSGNGTAARVDTLYWAHRVLLDHIYSDFTPVAQNVELGVAFNPAVVAEHRLIGYETQPADDRTGGSVPAADMRLGQSLTALYEITPVASAYSADDAPAEEGLGVPLATLSLTWTEPLTQTGQSSALSVPNLATHPTPDAQFATAIAGFGQLLRDTGLLGEWGGADAIALMDASLGPDASADRIEAQRLLQQALDLIVE